MLSHEYRVVRNRYSQLLFTSEDHLCTNLHMQEQSTNMTLQCQYLMFTWRHNAKSEKTILSDNGEIGGRQLFLAEVCV